MEAYQLEMTLAQAPVLTKTRQQKHQRKMSQIKDVLTVWSLLNCINESDPQLDENLPNTLNCIQYRPS